MTLVHVVLGSLVIVLFAAAGVLGTWRWYRVEQSVLFWRLLRPAQVLVVVEAALGGVLLLAGRRPDGNLHYVYGLLPIAVSFVAEQLRIAAAETVLEARGIPDAKAVGELPEREQRSVVVAILRRELGVMALASLIIAGLVLRAALGHGGV
jgi:hypothetical protein